MHDPDHANHTMNMITEGGDSSSSRKRYARQIMHIINTPRIERKMVSLEIKFANREANRLIPHENELMMGLDRSFDILYWDAFEVGSWDPTTIRGITGRLFRRAGAGPRTCHDVENHY